MTGVRSMIILAIIGMLTICINVVVSNNVEENVTLAKNESVVFAVIAQQMKFDVIQIQQWLTDISATHGHNGLNKGFDEAEKNKKSFLNGLVKFKNMYNRENSAENLHGINKIEQTFYVYYAKGRKMAQAYIGGREKEGNKIMSDFDKTAIDLTKSLEPLVKQQITELDTAMTDILYSVKGLKIKALIVSIIIFSVIISTFHVLSSQQKEFQAVGKLTVGNSTIQRNIQVQKREYDINEINESNQEVSELIKVIDDILIG